MEAAGLKAEISQPDVELTSHLTLRRFKLTDSMLGITDREVAQLHYKGWPDHGVPSGNSMSSFTQMLEIFTLMLLTSEPSEKTVVHCSAGIGRTGTTIALAHLIINLYAQINQGI